MLDYFRMPRKAKALEYKGFDEVVNEAPQPVLDPAVILGANRANELLKERQAIPVDPVNALPDDERYKRDYQSAKDWVEFNAGKDVGVFYMSTAKRVQALQITGPCHASLRGWGVGEDIIVFSSNTGIAWGAGRITETDRALAEEASEQYWAWLSDPEVSPYRDLLQSGIETIRRDDKLVGFVMPGESLNKYNRWNLFSFAVAARMNDEYNNSIRIWKMLVDKGMNPCDALYLSRTLTHHNGVLAMGQNNDGGHWPLNDSNIMRDNKYHYTSEGYYNGFSWDNFRNGKMNQKATDGSHTWIDYDLCGIKGRTPFKFTAAEVQGKTLRTTFSSRGIIDLDAVIEKFYKWQEANGIREAN